VDVMPGAEPFYSPGHGEHARTGVLVLHGITSTPQTVRPVAHRLAELGYAVSAPRLPGHGTTWQGMSRTTYHDWYATVEAAAVELGSRVDRTAAVGLSMGGALVTDLAAQRPDLVHALVLVNPAFAARDPRLLVLPYLRHVLPSLPGLGDDIRRPGGERELCYDRLPLRAFHSFVSRWPTLLQACAQVRVPVLLLRSAHDRVVPALSSEVFREHVASTDVTEVVLPRSGHVATLDHDAQELLDRTEAFLTRTVGARVTR
jgi:carboxylesterase